MALGGGTFTAQNKKLPGAYINFVSAATADATLSDRGIVTLALPMKWGAEHTVIELTKGDAIKKCRSIFGYSYTDSEMTWLRDIFANAVKLFAYRLNGIGGTKASSTLATAKHTGERGNDLGIKVAANIDDANKFDVSTYLGGVVIDKQTVASASGLVDNDFVVFKKTATLEAVAMQALTGGASASVTGDDYAAYLGDIESYSFNAIGYYATTPELTVSRLYEAFVKRMRDEVGKKFQLVAYTDGSTITFDYEGIIATNVLSAIPWLLGAQGGCAVNASCTNKLYSGEMDISTAVDTVSATQSQLEASIDAGILTFHRVGNDFRVLTDINTLKTTTQDKGNVFKSNQTIRVIDQIGNDIAVLFNTKYLGVIPNNASGRISLWGDIVKHHEQLQAIGAIENFNDANVVVTEGDTKRAVVVTDLVDIVNSMEQLYMTVTIA